MKYSIIVPIYGVEAYIEKCIDSLLAQTYQNVEIILVNDGSKDKCPQICNDYAIKYQNIIVVNKQNGGLVSARKAGLDYATGDYICCVDGDDWIDEEYINEFQKIIEKHSNVDIICAGFRKTSGRCQAYTFGIDEGFYDHNNIVKDLFPVLIQTERATRVFPTVWAKCIKSDIYKLFQKRVPDRIGMGEDACCILPLLSSVKSMYVSNKCLYNYRTIPTAMTKVKKVMNFENADMVFKHLTCNISSSYYDFKEQIARYYIHEVFGIMITQFYSQDSYGVIVKRLMKQYENSSFIEAVEMSRFSGSLKALVMQTCVNYKLFFLMKLLSYVYK